MDRDNSGYLDRSELRELIQDLNILLKDVELDNDFVFGERNENLKIDFSPKSNHCSSTIENNWPRRCFGFGF